MWSYGLSESEKSEVESRIYADMEYSVCQFTPVNIVSKACLGIGLICLLIDSIYGHAVSKPAGESSQTEKGI